ncbi:PAS domain-containing protein [Azoarcus sp. PA01]|nr:PAS domain-containing protein [Azoarcus sp. PA01]
MNGRSRPASRHSTSAGRKSAGIRSPNSRRSTSIPAGIFRVPTTSNALLERCFRRESQTYECEIRTRHKNGRGIWVLDRGRVVEWTHDAQPRRMSGMRQDISAQKKAAALVADDKERRHTI